MFMLTPVRDQCIFSIRGASLAVTTFRSHRLWLSANCWSYTTPYQIVPRSPYSTGSACGAPPGEIVPLVPKCQRGHDPTNLRKAAIGASIKNGRKQDNSEEDSLPLIRSSVTNIAFQKLNDLHRPVRRQH